MNNLQEITNEVIIQDINIFILVMLVKHYKPTTVADWEACFERLEVLSHKLGASITKLRSLNTH